MNELFNLKKYPLVYIIYRYLEYYDNEIKKEEVLNAIHDELYVYLSFVLDNTSDIEYLDYELKINKLADRIDIKASNIVTALWFIGKYPLNASLAINKNECRIQDKIYKFNEKTKLLTWIKNK